MSVGDRIKLAREIKGWSQEQLADAINVEIPTVSRWETGIHEPRPRHWPLLVNALGKSREWFEGESADSERLSRIETRIAELENVTPLNHPSADVASAWRGAEEWQRQVALFFLTLEEKYLDHRSVPEKLKKTLARGLQFFSAIRNGPASPGPKKSGRP